MRGENAHFYLCPRSVSKVIGQCVDVKIYDLCGSRWMGMRFWIFHDYSNKPYKPEARPVVRHCVATKWLTWFLEEGLVNSD